ncbi:hypothetical protein [Pedobacter sp. UYP1]|uniref:hypothetical protein n=1 Tax=Pedobacter sp. UYP1 TaxID=1756396 RepID=UPI00339AB685
MELFIKKICLTADKYKLKAYAFLKDWYDHKDKIIEWIKAINQVVLLVKFIIEILKIVQ